MADEDSVDEEQAADVEQEFEIAPEEPPEPLPDAAGDQAPSPLHGVVAWISLVSLLLLAVIPLSFANILLLSSDPVVHEARQVQLLVAASVLMFGGLAAFLVAGEPPKRRGSAAVGVRMKHSTRRELVLNSLSIGNSTLVVLLLVVEVIALFAFLEVVEASSSASIAFARNYLIFATFTLLFLDLLLIARLAYRTEVALKQVQKALAYILIALSALVLAITVLVSAGVLDTGYFAGVEARQSVYILTLATLLQLYAFKVLLRYPPVVSIAVAAIRNARRAGGEMREEIQKRAFRMYMVALGFVLLSIILVGGIATRQVTVQSQRTTDMILLLYLAVGLVVLGILVTRWLQHRFVLEKERRRETGEVIAKKRIDKQQLTRWIIYGSSGFFAFIFTVLGLLTLLGLTPLEDKFGTDFLIMAFLVGVGPFGFYRSYLINRQRAMDDKFPDFLRDLAESQRAGMTLPRALLTAARGTYGALTDEIRAMSAQVEWGVSFTEALTRFARRVDTPLINRAVVLITEAANAGGNVVDILTAASDDAREIKQILLERKQQMAIYSIIVYIAFFVYLTVIFVMAAQFLPGFEEAVGAASGQQVGGLNLAAFDKDQFITVFFHGALIQAIGGGLVAGVMTQGSAVDGLKHSFIMTIVSWVFFRAFI